MDKSKPEGKGSMRALDDAGLHPGLNVRGELGNTFGAEADLRGELTELHALIDRGAYQVTHVTDLLDAQEAILRAKACSGMAAGSGRRCVPS